MPPKIRWRVGAAAILLFVAILAVGVSKLREGQRISLATPTTPPSQIIASTNPGGPPVPLPASGALAPGTYFLANPYLGGSPAPNCIHGCADYQRIIFTLPAGWATSDGLVYKHKDQPGEVTFSAWTVGQVYADPCHWQGSALSSLDLTHHSHDSNGAIVLAPYQGGLANQALRGARPRALTPVTLAAVDGSGAPYPVGTLRIDLSVPAGLDISTCDKGQFRSWTVWEVADGANSHHASGQLDSVYMVDVDRRPLVIDASHMPATSNEDLTQLQAIVASMIIDRGGPALVGRSGAAISQRAPLDPGTYDYLDVDGAGFNVRFTVPAGWTWHGRYLSKGGVGPPEGAAIFFDGAPVQAYANPCQWAGSEAYSSFSVRELVAALAAQPMRGATTPTDRNANAPGRAGRWAGMAVLLTMPDNIVLADCSRGQFRSWYSLGPDENARSHQGPGQRDLVWAVDLTGNGVQAGGQRLIIDAASFPGTAGDVMSEIDAILVSISVGHWG
jgi:hypothetical protein